MDTDRNLLFGVLALQADLIDAGRFAEACSAWAATKAQPLADLLVGRGWITAEDRADVEKLLERKLRKHGGDAHASLVDAAGGEVLEAFGGVDDPEVLRSLAALPSRRGHTLISTVAYEPKTRERYTLTHLHAKGGLGQVWLALDGDLGRQVALKELRPERVDDPTLRDRFLEEARITGQLEHPGIIPVYELARRSADGQPFYTMRFIRGRTLAEAIKDYHRKREEDRAGMLDLVGLLTAFVGVCNAVAYAHSRKVIHRDLKPQNVVLGDFGEVIVLDWGLAKLVDRPEHSEPLPSVALGEGDARDPTLQGQVLGTPAYMAPEQAEGRLDRVDHRSDIYGLGSILYEILTGVPPFGGAGTRDVLRRVIHGAPDRPRDRVPTTPRALEAVCLKALAKSPEGRYETAGELAGEVQRYLADEPVAAYPEPAPVRAGRWVKRHRTAVAVAVALLLTATTGLAVGTVLLSRANAEVQRQRDLARRQRDLADANFAKARQAVDDYFTTVSESTLLKSPLPGLQPLRKRLLESALPYYEGFVQQHRDDASLRARLAGAAYRAGKIRAEVGGDRDAALESLRMARGLYEGLLRAEPRSPVYRHELARVEFETGKSLFFNGRRTEAIEATREAGALERELAREDPAALEYRRLLAYAENNLGVMLQETGHPPEAIDHFRRAIAAWAELMRAERTSAEDRRGLSLSQNNLGVILHLGGKWPEARAAYEEAIALLRDLDRLEPGNATYQNDLARALGNLGNLLGQDGRNEPASRALREALSISQEAVRRNPTVTVLLDDRAEVGNLLGEIQVATDQVDAGLRSFREVLDVVGRALRDNPDFAPRIEPRAVVSHLGIGRALSRLGRTPDALASLRRAIELGAKHAGQDPERLYHLARAQALYSAVAVQGKVQPTPAERAESDRSGTSAVATLKRAIAAGYRNLPWIRRDADLDPLRPRDDFKELIAGLESGQAAAK